MSKVLDQALIDWANEYLDDDERQQDFEALGRSLFSEFGAEKGRVSSQVRNLQSIANSAVRFSDIELFIKNQMGRNNRTAEKWGRLRPSALDQLKRIAEQTNVDGQYCVIPNDQRDAAKPLLVPLRLYLAHNWVRSVVGGYMFAKAQKELSELPTGANP